MAMSGGDTVGRCVPTRSWKPLRPGRDRFVLGQRYVGGTQAAPIGSPMRGTFTAIDSRTNKIVWQHKTPYRIGVARKGTGAHGARHVEIARVRSRNTSAISRLDTRGPMTDDK
jgi:hypothetical protein